jgi:aryl-alcohol dehydrogenase-like predicted oxidoreductase
MDTEGASGRDFGVRSSRRYIVRAVEESLRRLGTDRIDLYQFHTPDPVTPIEETLAALDSVVQQGKVLYIGHSNFAGWQIAQAEYLARQFGTARFVASQNHYNLLDRRAELEVLPAAQAFGLGVLPYFPLASGLLTGKYSSGRAPEGARLTHFRQDDFENADLAQLAAFGDFAEKRGFNEVQVAFSWLASRPAVASVIAGAIRPEQVAQNAAAVGYEFSVADGTWAGQFEIGDRAAVRGLSDLDPVYKQLLDGPVTAVVAVTGGTGRPNLTPVWFDYEDDKVLFDKVLLNLVSHRKKVDWPRRTPQAPCLLMNPQNAYYWMSVKATAVREISEDDAAEGARVTAQLDRVWAKRSGNQGSYPLREPGRNERRVLFELRVDSVATFGRP